MRARLLGGASLKFGRGRADLFERALAIQQRTLGPSHLDLAPTLTLLGRAMCKEARFTEALARYREAMELFRAAGVPRTHPRAAPTAELLDALEAVLERHDVAPIERGEKKSAAELTSLASRIAQQRKERGTSRRRAKQYAPESAGQPGSLIRAALEYDGVA